MYILPHHTVVVQQGVAAKVVGTVDVLAIEASLRASPKVCFDTLIKDGNLQLCVEADTALDFNHLPELAKQHITCQVRWPDFGKGLTLFEQIELMNNVDVAIMEENGTAISAAEFLDQLAAVLVDKEEVDLSQVYRDTLDAVRGGQYRQQLLDTTAAQGFVVITDQAGPDREENIAFTLGLTNTRGYEFVIASKGMSCTALQYIVQEFAAAVVQGNVSPVATRSDLIVDNSTGKQVVMVSTQISTKYTLEQLAAAVKVPDTTLCMFGTPGRWYQICAKDSADTVDFNAVLAEQSNPEE